ncbi:MAG: hypothetical protein FJ138_06625 [Deltaproteobacteria bacterium]|nr:hypothetical protein [Deltaproteobacteria bacterium]
MSSSLIIAGTTSSGKSALLNLLCGAWVAPVSVQPNTLSPLTISLVESPLTTPQITEQELARGAPVTRELWHLSAPRSWLQLTLALRERRLRASLAPLGASAPWMTLSRRARRSGAPLPSLTELPALERLSEPQGLPDLPAQRTYALKALKGASCVLFVFNAQETNPKVDEAALSHLSHALDRPLLLTLNRVDLYQADQDPQASLNRRLHQIKQTWTKLFGARPLPPLIPLSAELPALLYAAVNPRAGLSPAELRRIKGLMRAEEALEDVPLNPSDWTIEQQAQLLSKTLTAKGANRLFSSIAQALRSP